MKQDQINKIVNICDIMLTFENIGSILPEMKITGKAAEHMEIYKKIKDHVLNVDPINDDYILELSNQLSQ